MLSYLRLLPAKWTFLFGSRIRFKLLCSLRTDFLLMIIIFCAIFRSQNIVAKNNNERSKEQLSQKRFGADQEGISREKKIFFFQRAWSGKTKGLVFKRINLGEMMFKSSETWVVAQRKSTCLVTERSEGSNPAGSWLFSSPVYPISNASVIRSLTNAQHYWFSCKNKLSRSSWGKASLMQTYWAKKLNALVGRPKNYKGCSWYKVSPFRSVRNE